MPYMINDGISTFSQKILGTHNSDFQSVNIKMLRLTLNTKYSFPITSMMIEIYEQLQILSLNKVR